MGFTFGLNGRGIFFTLFSGFAATQGMKLTLDYFQVEGAVVPMLQTIANASAVFEYNSPAVILFSRRFSDRSKRLASAEIQILQQSYVKLLEQSAGHSRLDPTIYFLRKELLDLLSSALKREDITEEMKESINSLKNKQNTIECKSRQDNTAAQNLVRYGQFGLLVQATSSEDQLVQREKTTDDVANCQVNRELVSYSSR